MQVASAATVQVEVIDDCGNAVTAANGGAVQVTFTNGDPGIDLTDTGSGVWEGTWTPQNAATQVNLQVAATENGLTTNPSANVAGSETVVVQAASAGAAPSQLALPMPPARVRLPASGRARQLHRNIRNGSGG